MGRTALERVRDWLRPLRRTSLLGPLQDGWLLHDVLKRLPRERLHLPVLAPDEFASYIRVQTTLSPDRSYPGPLSFPIVIARQDLLNALDPGLLATLAASYGCTHANARYAVFERAAATEAAGTRVMARLAVLIEPGAPRPVRAVRPPDGDRAILVTTFNRPAALARALPQIAALGPATLVVDDGSAPAARERNRTIAEACGAAYLPLPANRGLCAAMNIGLDFLIADRRVEWISYFQDDVDVDPGAMDTLRRVEDREQRPLLTGYDADEHPATGRTEIAGVQVTSKRASPAVHLHAHVDYWRGVMPIPSEYLGAPRRRWEASLEDYWIVNNASGSVGQRGLPVICVPGLVRTFLWDHADSTWGNPNQPDPPLAFGIRH